MHGTPLFLFPPYRPSSSNCANGAMRKKPPSPSVCANGAMQKTAEERFNMLARGWLAYPVTPMHTHLPPKSGCRNPIPLLANNLYNRSSAVDSSFHNQPQVGEPTWGYNYPTALRRLPSPIVRHPQKTPSAIGHHLHRKNPPSSSDCANGAMRKKPPKSGLIR